jgi:hypothetical protein
MLARARAGGLGTARVRAWARCKASAVRSGLGRAAPSGWWRRGRRHQANTEAGVSGAVRVAVFYVGELQREGEIGGQEVQPGGL